MLPVELIFVMRALSTFEGVGRSLDPAFSGGDRRPYLPTHDLQRLRQQRSVQRTRPSGRGPQQPRRGLQRRLDESLNLRRWMQLRCGWANRIVSSVGWPWPSNDRPSVLLGCLAGHRDCGCQCRPLWSLLWLLLLCRWAGLVPNAGRIRRDQRLERCPVPPLIVRRGLGSGLAAGPWQHRRRRPGCPARLRCGSWPYLATARCG